MMKEILLFGRFIMDGVAKPMIKDEESQMVHTHIHTYTPTTIYHLHTHTPTCACARTHTHTAELVVMSTFRQTLLSMLLLYL